MITAILVKFDMKWPFTEYFSQCIQSSSQPVRILTMTSVQTLKLYIKLGLLPLAKDKDGQPKVDLSNRGFVILNLFRFLCLCVYFYFSIKDFLNSDLNNKSVISFSFRAIGYLGGSGMGVLLAITGQRLGRNSFLGMSNSCCLMNWMIIGSIVTIYSIGSIVYEIPMFLRLNSLEEIMVLSVTLIFLILFVIVDYGVVLSVCFQWTKDLKLKINNMCFEKNLPFEKFEEVLKDFSKLRHSMKLLGLIMFPLVQLLAITSAYLGFTAGWYKFLLFNPI